MDFLAFIEQTQKENNTCFIDLLIIENVELLNLKGFCGESVLYRRNWTCHLHDVSVFIINGFVYCSIFVY